MLLVYVDDIVITGTNTALIFQLQERLQSSFHMKDLGPRQYFLGLEVHFTTTSIFLHQHKYIQELISLAGLQEGRSVDTPLEVNVKYRRDDGDFLSNPALYRQLVGSLNYLTITRPDISFVVQQVSQFMKAPTHLHLVVVRRIVRYLHGTSARGLFFPVDSPIRLLFAWHIVMLIGLVVLTLAVQLLGGACFLVTLLFLGKVRSKIGCLSPPLSLNIVLCPLPVLKLFGFGDF